MNFELIDDYLFLIKNVASNKKLKVIISIQNTNNINDNFYLLPPRISNKYLICGICNSDKNSLDYFLRKGTKLTDILLLDLEIKKRFFAEDSFQKFNTYQEYINFKFPNLKIFYFSANLLTIQSVLRRIYKKKKLLIENKAVLVGLGNIGIKLSLSLLDLRIRTTVYSDKLKKLNSLSNIINQIYDISDINNIFQTSNKLHESLNESNLLIISTPSINVLDYKAIQRMQDNSSIISLSSLPYDKQIDEIIKIKKIDFEYANIGFELLSYVDYLDFISHSFAIPIRSDGEDHSFVSGGYRGIPGDTIVDNAKDPTFQIGIIEKDGKFTSSFKLIKND